MKWINVKDQLPDRLPIGQYKRYLICFPGGHVCEASWLDEEFCLRHDGCSSVHPICWMPLPNPPKLNEYYSASQMEEVSKLLREAQKELMAKEKQLIVAKEKINGLILECTELEQRLGKALGYPWYKDDPKNFPNATESNGVCVGEHTPGTIAAEAADAIERLRAENRKLALTVSSQTMRIAELERKLATWSGYHDVSDLYKNPAQPKLKDKEP